LPFRQLFFGLVDEKKEMKKNVSDGTAQEEIIQGCRGPFLRIAITITSTSI
jgi:hypothetical protein